MAMPQDPEATRIEVQPRDPQPVLAVWARVLVTEPARVQGKGAEGAVELPAAPRRPAHRPCPCSLPQLRGGRDRRGGRHPGPVAAGPGGAGRVAADELPGGSVVRR
jgi:hypothetical protein